MRRTTITLMLLLFVSFIFHPGLAATKAGTRITNQASASYFDTGTGEIIHILSNIATFVVAPVLAVEQDQDQETQAASGQLVYFPHTVTNTGNQPDTYRLDVENMIGDNGDLENLQIYLDENGDGLVNPGEQLITDTNRLEPNQQIQIVVVGMVPNNAAEGDQYSISVTTQSNSSPMVKDRDIDTVTTADGPIIRISRNSDVDCGIPLKLNDRTYNEISFTNLGNEMPSERDLMVDGQNFTGTLLYEALPPAFTLLKEPAFFSKPAMGMLVVGTPLGEWLSYESWDNTTLIDKLGVLMPATYMKPGQSGKYGYSLQVTQLPVEDTSYELQTQLDLNHDGRPDFHSNPTCNTVGKDEDLVIKERPSLVLHGVVFDSANLVKLEGAKVTLYSDDDNAVVANTTSDAQGYYEFADIETGYYYLDTTPILGYELSIHPPDYFTTFEVSDPSYGQNGYIPPNASARPDDPGVMMLDMKQKAQKVDIPLDREGIRGQIAIEKSSSTKTVSIGEPIGYTVKVSNLTKQDLYAAYIKDTLPPGFKYLPGTAKLDDQFIDDPKISRNSKNGRTELSFRIGDFLAEAEHTLTYVTQVTAMGTNSDGINTAYAHADTITDILITSPVARAQVEVTQDGVLSDRAIIFGRVALPAGCVIGDDQALIDEGYPLAGVRLYMEDGTYVITDKNGQYSLYGLQPGLHVLKVDNHSLPEGLNLTVTANAQANDPDSRFADLRPGDFYRADFTAACPEQISRQVERCHLVEAETVVKRKKLVAPAAPVKVRQCENQPVEKKTTKTVTRTINNVIQPIQFDSGKADIPADYISKLSKLITLTKNKQNVRFRFVGHTDNQQLKASTKKQFGTNLALSKARATEVAQHVLQELHIETRVNVEGMGDSQPVASNDSAAGMAKNRRVELVMMYDEPEVFITRTTKEVCTMKTVAPEGKLAKRIQQAEEEVVTTKAPPRRVCETKTETQQNPVILQILSNTKVADTGWKNEIESIDPANNGNLQNLSKLAGEDGDISNGLVEAYRQQITKHQEDFAAKQAGAETAAETNLPEMPNPKEAVKTITREQGKAGTWLWPLGDTSLDGRFVAVVRAGLTPTLFVNDKAVPTSQLGEQIENKKEKAQILAWYGVQLEDGENKLKITAKGPFGNERVLTEKVVKRPSSGVALKMSVDETLTADGGRSMVPVNIEVLDSNGYPAKGTYFLTVETSDGMWAEPDIQDKVPGHQVKVTNGQRTIHLRSSNQSGKIKLRASTGKLQSETDVSQIAEMRPLIAVGLLDLRAHKGYRDGFENIGLMQLDKDAEDIEVNGRAALFMKGRIKGDMHLTLSYDNQKDPDAELLRDINPGEYYRVYGDSSIRGFEAQSRSQLYAKLEKDRHSIMWGDYVTDNGGSSADIARSSRTLTGLNGIYDDGKTRIQAFGAQQDNLRGVEEFPGNGTAMHYQLVGTPIVENSEIIEIIVRDRQNSGLIIATETLKRFRDYSIDDVTGYITFHRVIPTLDDELNPVSIRITYDSIEEGESYLVAGVRVMHRLSDELKVGSSYTQDDHDTEGYRMVGIYAEYQDETSQLEAGVAKMSHNDGSEGGTAVRIKATKKWSADSRTEVMAAQADAGFTNNSGGVVASRREIKVTQRQKLGKDLIGTDLDAKAEFSHSESLATDDTRQSLELSATTRIDDWKLKAGARQIRQTTEGETDKVNTAIIGVERGIEVFGKKGSVKAEYEREIGSESRQRASIGADMQINDKAKAYVRYEQADRLSSGTLAGSVETTNNLVAGVKAQVLPSTEVYSEYRINGSISGEDVVAVNGAKATLDIEENLVVTPSIEFLNYLESDDKEDSIAASVGLTDTRDKDSKKMLRVETRHSGDEQFYGINGTYVQKFNDSTTILLQDELRLNKYDDDREDTMQNTLTMAAAHRPTGDDDYNALYAYKWITNDAENKDTHVLSTHQNYRINEDLAISGRLGAKKQTLNVGSNSYSSDALMADARAEWDVTDRVSIDVHGGILGTNGFAEKQYSAGAGVNVNVVDNVRLGAGYNFTGFTDKDLDASGMNAKGMYLGLQMKADEALFGWLSGDERRLVDERCEPIKGMDVTDHDLQKQLRKQMERCTASRGGVSAAPPLPPEDQLIEMTPDYNTQQEGARK